MLPCGLLLKSVLFLATTLASAQTVQYEVDLANAIHHEAHVRATFSGVKSKSLEVLMSRASPGRYAAHEFAKNVYEIRTTNSHGKEIPREQADNNRWLISGHDGTVIFEYTLFGDRVDGTYVGIDRTHAHLNMPGTVVWARGLESRPIRIRFTPPQGEAWTVATQLDERADGWWFAPNLDYLMDSPTDIGPHQFSEWTVGEAKFRMALHHTGSAASTTSFLAKAQSITAEEEGVFGNFPRYDFGRYTFVADYLPYASGDGMEHRNSTSITAGATIEQNGDRLLGTLAHEFFHSWNMERIRSKGIEPFHYDHPNMSGELWFGEGFTNYYEELALHRSGIIDFNQFLESLTSFVNTVVASPGRLMHSAVEMSRLAPYVDAATSIDKTNRENTFISYYTYGAALGVGIDLKIREIGRAHV